MSKDVTVQTDKYKFIFYNYDSDNVVTTTLTISTKKVTAARAKQMLLECNTKNISTKFYEMDKKLIQGA